MAVALTVGGIRVAGLRHLRLGGAQAKPLAAFYEHDPEVHPLEFLAFPFDNLPTRWQRQQQARDPFLAIDHPTAEVTAMAPAQATPHVELRRYRKTDKGDSLDLRINDVAATCLVFEAGRHSLHPEVRAPPGQNLVDLDGHHLAIVWTGR